MDQAKHPLHKHQQWRGWSIWHLLALSACTVSAMIWADLFSTPGEFLHVATAPIPPLAARQAILRQCRSLRVKPGPPTGLTKPRTRSDRYVEGTQPVMIHNATVWTGNDNGREVLRRVELLLSNGIIRWMSTSHLTMPDLTNVEHVDAMGGWVTPGIVDMHSHLAVGPSPMTEGASGGNSWHGPILPWLRALDELNTHDEGYKLAIAGGVTTSLILPGSANAIGGQAYPIKLRPTNEKTPTSMLLDPFNGSEYRPWRHMKHACGENPARIYGQTRMDTNWQLRKAYSTAQGIKEQQDAFCELAETGRWTELAKQTKGDEVKLPEDLKWESLVEVLRGRVKVHTHCYEAVDLDAFVRLSNEFKFPVAAFHHASEAYLVPDVLKKAYGDQPPAAAMFATFSRYKRESFRHSEFAPRILSDADIRVIMKSDHPAVVSRYLLFEAQKVFYFGLPANVALRSVISTPADVMGAGWRIGYVREGWDADIVLWDSHPLALGATPVRVFVDGISQLPPEASVQLKPSEFQVEPKVPLWDKERADTIKWEGLPPLEPRPPKADLVILNVKSLWTQWDEEILQQQEGKMFTVVVRDGKLSEVCSDACNDDLKGVFTIDLEGGSLGPGLVSYGAALGLSEISLEESTGDGQGGGRPYHGIIRAVDGLHLGSRNALLAYRAGVTSSIAVPMSSDPNSIIVGLGTRFSTGAIGKWEKGSVLNDIASLHVKISYTAKTSVSGQVAQLRRMLLDVELGGDVGKWFEFVRKGEITLVVQTDSADVIATLIRLKQELAWDYGLHPKLVISGGTEAHLLAKELAEAKIGVILNPPRPFPYFWENQRILPGPPLSPKSAVQHLLEHNVTVGLGVMEIGGEAADIDGSAATDARFDVGWVALESSGAIDKRTAYALGSRNILALLGIEDTEPDLVLSRSGDLLDFGSKVVGVLKRGAGSGVHLFED